MTAHDTARQAAADHCCPDSDHYHVGRCTKSGFDAGVAWAREQMTDPQPPTLTEAEQAELFAAVPIDSLAATEVLYPLVERILAAHHAQATQQGRDEAGLRERVKALADKWERHAMLFVSPKDQQTREDWEHVAASLRAALAADTTTPADEPERRGGGA